MHACHNNDKYDHLLFYSFFFRGYYTVKITLFTLPHSSIFSSSYDDFYH